MKKFDTIKFDDSKVLKKDGMEIRSYIAGVNSGVYNLPFVIEVSCWARKWIFSKFFKRSMRLNLFQVKQLKSELEKVVDHFEEKKTDSKSNDEIFKHLKRPSDVSIHKIDTSKIDDAVCDDQKLTLTDFIKYLESHKEYKSADKINTHALSKVIYRMRDFREAKMFTYLDEINDIDIMRCRNTGQKTVDKFNLLREEFRLKKMSEKIHKATVDLKVDLNQEFLNSVCMSYRHDFGLMSLKEQGQLRFELRNWIIAIKKNQHLI